MAVTFCDGEPIALMPATAETLIGAEVAARLHTMNTETRTKDDPGVCVVTDNPAALWRYMDDRGPACGEDYQAWGTVRVAHIQTAATIPDGASIQRVTAVFAGFRWGKRRGVMVLDPTAYCDASAADVIGAHHGDTAEHTLMRLSLWASDLVRWCAAAGVHMRPSRGGIGAQFLTDARFFPRRRRKVPAWINDLVRPYLPGNFYRVLSDRHHRSALELDQRGAHHQAAARIAFTDPDTLGGFGHVTDPTGAGVFMRPDDPAWADFVTRPGLYFLRVRVSRESGTHPYQLPELCGEGERTAAVWSVELPAVLDDPGIEVLWIVAAVVSRPRDDDDQGAGLRGYGEWAWDQLGITPPRRAAWLKGLLLSVYGVLAQGARPMGRFSSEPTAHSVPMVVVLGGAIAHVHVAVSRRTTEPGYANVCDRGLIEAETRQESRRLAAAVEAERAAFGAELVAIYADAVIVATPDGDHGGALAGDADEHARWARARTRAEWRARPRSHLQMLGAHGYTSAEVTKMPGVPRASRTPTGENVT